MRTRINAALPRLRIEFVQILSDVVNDLAGNPRPVDIKLFGSDLTLLESYGKKLGEKLEKVDGLEDVYNGVSEPGAELAMTINSAEANRAGMTPEEVSSQVAGALLGVEAGNLRLQDRSVGIRARAPDSVRFNPQHLTALPLVSPTTRSPVELGNVAEFKPTDTRSELSSR